MVNQVAAVGILMIVQGALEIVLGLILIAAAMFVPSLLEEAARQQAQFQPANAAAPNPLPFLPDPFAQMAAAIYLSMALAGLVPGIIRIVAGVRSLSYRGRTMAITANIVGLLSIGTCYCSLTSVGLAIYALIVLFNRDVERAFALGEQGVPGDEIKTRYARSHYRFRDDDELRAEEPPRREDGWSDSTPDSNRPGNDDHRFRAR